MLTIKVVNKVLGLAPLPTREEVWEATHPELWRSKQYIRELITQTRLNEGKEIPGDSALEWIVDTFNSQIMHLISKLKEKYKPYTEEKNLEIELAQKTPMEAVSQQEYW